MHVRWKSSIQLSALHSAWCASSFPECLRRCSSELLSAAGELAECAPRLSLPPPRFWDLLMVACVDAPQPDELAKSILRSLVATARSAPILGNLKPAIEAVQSRFDADYPNYEAEIQLRIEPLRGQWEAFGPGLLRQIAGWVGEPMFDEAECFVVQPIVGGMGYCHLLSNRCHIEAVLTDADPQLTEALRLAWLLSQLDFQKTTKPAMGNSFRIRQLAGLAMLPPTLEAAQALDLCVLSVSTLERALRLWRIVPGGEQASGLAEVLHQWWQASLSNRPGWKQSLTVLERLLTSL